MKKLNSFLVIGVALIGLTACDSMTPDQRAVAGGLGGAAVGGILGNTIGGGTGRTIATIAGAGLGAVAGSSLARGTNNNNNSDNQTRYYRGRDGRFYPVQ
jgi:outer membrane lipoprotein SlyB